MLIKKKKPHFSVFNQQSLIPKIIMKILISKLFFVYYKAKFVLDQLAEQLTQLACTIAIIALICNPVTEISLALLFYLYSSKKIKTVNYFFFMCQSIWMRFAQKNSKNIHGKTKYLIEQQ